jgi:hypothetical protein
MANATKKIVCSVEVDQGGGRWLSILKTESFEHAQAFAEDARAGGSKVRINEETMRDRPKRPKKVRGREGAACVKIASKPALGGRQNRGSVRIDRARPARFCENRKSVNMNRFGATAMHAPHRSSSSQSKRQDVRRMHAALRRWIEQSLAYQRRQMMFLPPQPRAELQEMERAQRHLTARMAPEARQYLSYVMRDNSDLDADKLAEIAEALSPGGAHNGADLFWNLLDAKVVIDPLIRAALIYYNWHGGKAGFQFLPDPAATAFSTYRKHAETLAWMLGDGHGVDPARILVEEDRDFFERLPDRFTAYRGVAGVTARKAGLGACWTVSRCRVVCPSRRDQGAKANGRFENRLKKRLPARQCG